ncbi:hypothetical protein GTPT_1591 [Tatumella ptyseos ATCC 33301]|uniref:Uncharacterized protein n=2 Tax=Tatumella ptyseos TaxID=82987 RepID=A0A085JGR4_9GAMM|nr:hypothetical protein GTPT_1591 [Tatumella ptyseos ATCC 33301]SQK75783.1 Uncharacterised protein [Tatumella ptyseos]
MGKIRAIALTRPCSNCPFLDSPESISHTLKSGRLAGIKSGLLADDITPFLCHKTLSGHEDVNGKYQHSGKEAHCMGSMAWLYNQGRFNISMRLAAMDKTWLENLKQSALLVVR